MHPDYKNSILNVSNTFLRHYGVNTSIPGIDVLEKELKNDYNHVIYILLDGMGMSTINAHLSETDALRKYVRTPITSVFPPTTVAATSAVLSAKPPITNGHLGWVQYFEQEDSNVTIFLNEDYYTHQTFDYSIRDTYLGYDDILSLIHNSNPDVKTERFFPDFIPGGSKSFAEEIERVLIKVNNTDQSFNYVYYTEPDLSTHIYGVQSNEVKRIIKGLNKDFTELIENTNDDTLIICIADHGLTDVVEIPFHEYTDLTTLLKRQPSLEPRCANFFIKNGKQDEFKTKFNSYFNEDYTLYTKTEFLQTGLIGTGEMHKQINQFLGDFIAVAKTNKMFIFSKSKGYKAHHAGLSDEEMMVPLIIYSNKKNGFSSN